VATVLCAKLKKRTALFEKLREIFRQHVSWPVEIVIAKINPILRGWVNYFRVGHSSSCFAMVKQREIRTLGAMWRGLETDSRFGY
jgi:hypothetical protein